MPSSPTNSGPARRPGRSYAPTRSDAKPGSQYLGKEDIRVALIAAARAARVGRGMTTRLGERLDELLATGAVPYALGGLCGTRWAVEANQVAVIAELLGLPVPAIDFV